MNKKDKKVPELRFPEFTEDWEKKRLGEITKIYDGTHQTPKYIRSGIPFFSVENITQNNYTDTKFISEKDYEREFKKKSIEKDDILITRIGDIGSAKCFDEDIKAGYYVSVALIKHSQYFISKFVKFYIETKIFQTELYKRTLHIAFPKKINLNEISKCNIKTPSFPEQTKIANFFTAVDKRIEILQKKKENLEKYKKGIMQKIFSQEIRFKDNNGNDFPDWEEKKLGEMLIHLSERNKNNKVQNVLSVSNTKGFLSQKEQFEKHRVASKDVSNYKIVRKNEFAYNPSRINVGSIARLKNKEIGIVSPMYVVFKTNKNLNSLFFEYMTELHLFKHFVKIGCSGSVRDSLNYVDLANFKFYFPSKPEQTKIANFLSSIDKSIETIEKQIEQSQRWKKGLLQKMFV